MYKTLELNSNKNDLAKKMVEGWENYRILGSLNNSRIKERNRELRRSEI